MCSTPWFPSQANGGITPVPGPPLVPGLVFGPLGKALPSKGSKILPESRLPGFGAHSSGTVPQSQHPPGAGVGFLATSPGPPPYLPQEKENMAAPAPVSGPTLGPLPGFVVECA